MDSWTPKFDAIHWDQVLNVPWSPSDVALSDYSAQTPCSDAESPASSGNPYQVDVDDERTIRPGSTTSTAFYPGADTYYLPSDIVLVSSDLVCFHVHAELLLIVSKNRLNSLLSPASPRIVHARTSQKTFIEVSEQSHILNIILHVAYGLSVTPYAPTFEMLSLAMDRLPEYGIEPKIATASASAFHSTLMIHAPHNSLKLYTLASKHDCFQLAASTSTFLLSHRVEDMTDATAENIGAVYLKRLFLLQHHRAAALGRILEARPHTHLPTPTCNMDGQGAVSRAWTLASAYLTWDGRSDVSPSQVDSTLRSLPANVSCPLCKKGLHDHIDTVVQNYKESVCQIPSSNSRFLIWASYTDTLLSAFYIKKCLEEYTQPDASLLA